jgi:hypothetical protein
MRRHSDFWPAVVGGALGLAVAGYAVVYRPMMRNFEHCGRATLCPDPQGTEAGTDEAAA